MLHKDRSMQMRKRLLMSALLTLSCWGALADNLTIPNATLIPGKPQKVSIRLTNGSGRYTAFQFDLKLPDGVRLEKNESDGLKARLNASRVTDHQLYSAEVGVNTYRFLAYSITNAEISGTDGELVNITLAADEGLGGEVEAQLEMQVFVDPDGISSVFDDQSCSLSVFTGETESITISDAKQVPYYSDKNLDFTDKPELKAYVATGYDKSTGTIWLSRVKQVPANTGFLLIGEADDYDIPTIEGVSDVYYKNMFKGTLEGTTLYTTDGDYTNYYLSKGDAGVGFYKVTKEDGVKVGANRCYLPILTEIPANGSTGDTEMIKVSAAKQVPYFTSKDLDFSSLDAQGVKAYTATGYNYSTGVIWLTRVKKVPAKTGILVMADVEGDYNVPTTSVQSVYENMFVGSETAQTIYTNEEIGGVDYVNYYLSKGDAGVGFYKVTNEDGVKMGANRCYLPIPKRDAASGARGKNGEYAFCKMVLSDEANDDVIAIPVFGGMNGEDDGTTGINSQFSIFNSQFEEVYYNLQGQRVENPGKGVFIKNGRKVVIK